MSLRLLCLFNQTRKTGFDFRYNVLHSNKVIFNLSQLAEDVIPSSLIADDPGCFLEEEASFPGRQTEGSIHKSLSNNGVSTLAHASLGE